MPTAKGFGSTLLGMFGSQQPEEQPESQAPAPSSTPSPMSATQPSTSTVLKLDGASAHRVVAVSTSDPQVLELAKEFGQRVRAKTSAMYRNFQAIKERMIKKNPNVGLDLVCAAAGVEGAHLAEEVDGFLNSLEQIAAGEAHELDSARSAETQQLQARAAANDKAKADHLRIIAEMEAAIAQRRQLADECDKTATEIAAQLGAIDERFHGARAKLEQALSSVRSELENEKRSFLS